MKDFRNVWAKRFANEAEYRNIDWAFDADWGYELATQPWQETDKWRVRCAEKAAAEQNEYTVRDDRADMVLTVALQDRRVHISTKARDMDGNCVIYISRRNDGMPVARFCVLAVKDFIEKRMYKHNILGYPSFDD